jgi:hypothetical protein
MRSWLTRITIGALAASALAIGPVTALASPHRHHVRHHRAVRASTLVAVSNTTEAPEGSAEAPGTGPDNDSSQQAAACSKAGVDPNGSNVQYDEQTGTCTPDGGGGGGDQTQQ